MKLSKEEREEKLYKVIGYVITINGLLLALGLYLDTNVV